MSIFWGKRKEKPEPLKPTVQGSNATLPVLVKLNPAFEVTAHADVKKMSTDALGTLIEQATAELKLRSFIIARNDADAQALRQA